MKVVFAVNNSCIVTANFVACHGGNLVERAELPTDPQTMRVHVDIVAAHDFFHRVVLKFNFVLDLLFHCLFLILIISAARGGDLIVSTRVILTHNVIHLFICIINRHVRLLFLRCCTLVLLLSTLHLLFLLEDDEAFRLFMKHLRQLFLLPDCLLAEEVVTDERRIVRVDTDADTEN